MVQNQHMRTLLTEGHIIERCATVRVMSCARGAGVTLWLVLLSALQLAPRVQHAQPAAAV
jgi:hypothetical protein